ncbi:MAG: heavy-metal-associated domain-containing protein [Eubacterium sp.]|nr:heavy-metal-associated domain-containing protein [Eubacterium sp.]
MIQAMIIIVLAALIIWAVRKTVKKSRQGGGCCPEHEETVKKQGVEDRDKSHYPFKATLEIGGMTCDNCARRVENALNSLDGTWASVSIADRRAKVLSKRPPDQEELSGAVIGAGYVVTGIKIES